MPRNAGAIITKSVIQTYLVIIERFRNLIGNGISRRFQHFQTDFTGAISKLQEIRNEIG